MNADPYAALGIPRDADTPAIRRAYRRAAKSAHPDHGGNPARWQALQLAHDVLTDAERRARYDKTGDTAEPPKDTLFTRAVAILARGLDEALQKLERDNGNVRAVDMAAFIGAALAGWKRQADAEVTKLWRAEQVNREMAERFESATEDNVMRNVALARIDQIVGQRETIKGNMVALDLALKLLSDARYRWDRPSQQGLGQYMLGMQQQGFGA